MTRPSATKADRQAKYWICDECVALKHPDWKPPRGNITVIKGLCGHCERTDEVTLTPVIDYDRGPGKRQVYD